MFTIVVFGNKKDTLEGLVIIQQSPYVLFKMIYSTIPLRFILSGEVL